MLRHTNYRDCLKAVCVTDEAHISTHLKIMDIVPPLVDLYCKYFPWEWGKKRCKPRMLFRQFFSSRKWRTITKHRRVGGRSFVGFICGPHLWFLSLSSPGAYTPRKEAVALLFYGYVLRELEWMLKEATQDSTLIQLQGVADSFFKWRRGKNGRIFFFDFSLFFP